jgi:hypothetical protein
MIAAKCAAPAPSIDASAAASIVVVPVRCVTAWCSKPSSPTTFTIPPTKASSHAPAHTHRGSFVIIS